MCRPAQCQTCGKATYTGCGAHVEQVLRGVPDADRCKCRETEARTRGPDAAGERRRP